MRTAPQLLLLSVPALAGALPAQSVAYRLPVGIPGGDSTTRAIGDWNGDGHGDFAVRSRLPIPNATSLAVVSGRDGTVLATFGRGAIETGDLDGDGRYEVIHSGAVYVAGEVEVRGTDGALRFRIAVPAGSDSFGSLVRIVGDWNRDGVADVAVAGPIDGSFRGRVYAFSGADGAPLCDFGAARPYAVFGIDVQGIADVDGDGIGDVVVGQQGSAGVYAGGSGRHIRELGPSGPQDYRFWYGSAVDVVGDVDGDGVADMVVGCEYGNLARLCSGATGKVLHAVHGGDGDRFGVDVARVGDADGDGLADFAVGGAQTTVRGFGPGYVTVFSSRTGAELFSVRESGSGAFFGRTVSGCGDVDGDGEPDFSVGSSASAPLQAIATRVMPLSSDGHLLPVATGGEQRLFLAAGEAHGGATYLVLGSLSGISPGSRLGPLHLPLNLDPYLMASAGMANRGPFVGTFGVLAGDGSAAAAVRVPALPAGFAGLRFDHAWVVADASGALRAASNAVPLTLQ